MTDTLKDELTPAMQAAISAAADKNKTPVLNDQKSHSQCLQAAMFKGAKDAERKFRREHPEASPSLMTNISTLAYKRKPPAYFRYREGLIDGWLSGQRDCSETNAATIDQIRDKFPDYQFADNLLNKPLSSSALNNAKTVAANKGVYLDTKAFNTLSKIKGAVRQGKLSPATRERIVIDATISDSHFGRFKIDRHGKQETIRFRRPDGTRRRIAVADLRALADLLVEAGRDGEHSLLSLYDIGICDQNRCSPQYSVKAPETEVLPQNFTGNCNQSFTVIRPQNFGDAQNSCDGLHAEVETFPETITGIGDQTFGEPERPGLTERIAALKLAQNPVTKPTLYSPEFDPLCHLTDVKAPTC